MMKLNVIVSIGDPWELGEAVGWVKPNGVLDVGSSKEGQLNLLDGVEFQGIFYKSFDVSTRHVGDDLESIGEDGVACNFTSRGPSKRLIFTGALRSA